MKTNPHPRITEQGLPALVALVCVLSLGAQAAPKRPVFAEIPGVTQPLPPAPTNAVDRKAAPLPAAPAPAPAPPAPAAAPAPAAPAAPAAELKAVPEDKTVYSFQADNLDLRAALATFARANDLNIVPDNNLTGTVTVDVRNLPLKQMMRALLEASDCSWQEEGGLIRVRNTETRTFAVDYLRLTRTGEGQSSALLSSGSGGAGGGMGGGMGGGSGGGASSTMVGNVSSTAGSSINLTAHNPIDFWKELKVELSSLLTEQGRQSLAINMTAGLVEITDRPSVLKKVEHYLEGVDKSIHRQVDIDVKLYSVTLNDQFQFGIDWVHAAEAYGGLLGYGASTLPTAIGGQQVQDSALSGLNHRVGDVVEGGNLSTLVFRNFNTEAAVNALKAQGKVEVISKPRVRTLNNQTALVKVGEDKPFFITSSTVQQSGTVQPLTSVNTVVNSVTIGTILSLTPQISEDDWISLDISPVLTSLIAIVFAPPINGSTSGSTSSGTTAPDLETKQASSLVRVRDGTTVVLGGLIQTTLAKNETKVPLLGDIPLLGWLFTGTYDSKLKQELVIFVTPHIVSEDEPSVNADVEHRPAQPVAWK